MVNLFGYPSCTHRNIHLFCDTQAIKFMGLLKKIGLDIEVSSLHQICVHTRLCIELLLRCLHSFLPTNESDFCQFKCLCEVYYSFIFLISFTHKSNCLFWPWFHRSEFIKALHSGGCLLYQLICFFSELFWTNGNLLFIWILMLHLLFFHL